MNGWKILGNPTVGCTNAVDDTSAVQANAVQKLTVQRRHYTPIGKRLNDTAVIQTRQAMQFQKSAKQRRLLEIRFSKTQATLHPRPGKAGKGEKLNRFKLLFNPRSPQRLSSRFLYGLCKITEKAVTVGVICDRDAAASDRGETFRQSAANLLAK